MSGLPPGFQFFPSDEELVVHFLYRKAALLPCQPDIIPSLDLHHCDPWQLHGKALHGGNQWYFFSHKNKNRVSGSGYWMPIGDDELITSGQSIVGIKKTLIFFIGEDPQGIKTNWMMHEYHLLDGVSSACSSTCNQSRASSKKRGHPGIVANKWVLCRVYDASVGSQTSFYDEGTELSCLDEAFLSLEDDYEEISMPNLDPRL